MSYPDFSEQVYALQLIAERVPGLDPYHAELVWILPPGTGMADPQPDDHPRPRAMPHLFGLPVETRDVDRPYLAVRPKIPPMPGPPLIRSPASHALRDYDREADTIIGRARPER
jgi:hypothetical protein